MTLLRRRPAAWPIWRCVTSHHPQPACQSFNCSVCGGPPPGDLAQEAVDPAYGGEELAELRKEVQRLGHAAGELARAQEGLLADLERAVAKREVIGSKVRAPVPPSRGAAPGAPGCASGWQAGIWRDERVLEGGEGDQNYVRGCRLISQRQRAAALDTFMVSQLPTVPCLHARRCSLHPLLVTAQPDPAAGPDVPEQPHAGGGPGAGAAPGS